MVYQNKNLNQSPINKINFSAIIYPETSKGLISFMHGKINQVFVIFIRRFYLGILLKNNKNEKPFMLVSRKVKLLKNKWQKINVEIKFNDYVKLDVEAFGKYSKTRKISYKKSSKRQLPKYENLLHLFP